MPELWVVYLVRCRDGSLYCGVAVDVEERIARHNSGRGARYTRGRGPVELAGLSRAMSRGDALRLEQRIKRSPRSRKLALLLAEGGEGA